MGHLTYLVLEVVWAVPVLALQWAVGWRRLWRCRRVLLLAVVLPTAYLSLADGVAIASGVWVLHGARTMGLRLADVPVEEVLFFSLTNAMVVQSVVLIARRPGTA